MQVFNRITRRNFLIVTGGSALAGLAAWLGWRKSQPEHWTEQTRALMSAVLDTLIPRDITPSATDLGVDKAILQGPGAQIAYRGKTVAGLLWCDEQARAMFGRGFVELGTIDRDAVLQAALVVPANSMPQLFVLSLRDAAFLHYYAHPDAWKGLAYEGPPQPQGYPSYHKVPL